MRTFLKHISYESFWYFLSYFNQDLLPIDDPIFWTFFPSAFVFVGGRFLLHATHTAALISMLGVV